MTTDKKIYLDFPEIWDMIINYKECPCRINDPNNVTNFAGNCTNFGNRITIPIAVTDSNSYNYYYLVLDGLRNPDMAGCDPNKIIVSLSSGDESKVDFRSHT